MIRRPLRTAPRRAHPSAALFLALVAGTALAATVAGNLGATPAVQAGDAGRIPLIVYQGQDRLHTVWPDGSHDVALDRSVLWNARHMDWSPDGAQLVFEVDEAADETGDLWVSDADGRNAHRLLDFQLPCWVFDVPAWSPDGRSIAFDHDDQIDGHNPGSQLEILDLATSTVHTVATTTTPDFIGDVRWSPDGTQLVVSVNTYVEIDASNEIEARRLAVVDLTDATPSLRFLDTVEEAGYPDWHPSGDRILFQAGLSDPEHMEDQMFDLYTIGADGSDEVQLTHLGLSDPVVWMPTWSADGSSILVTLTDRLVGGVHTIGRLSADGTGLEQLPGPVRGAHPRQSRGTLVDE